MKRGLPLALRAIALLVCGLAGAAGAAAQPACDCKDVVDLQARYCQAQAAVREWERLINWSTGRVERKQTVERFTVTGKSEVEQCVDEAIGMVRNEFTGNSGSKISTPNVRAETDNRNCAVKVDAPTACLREVLGKHEQLHHGVCRSVTSGDATGGRDFGFVQNFVVRNVNWRLAYSLSSYMVEERSAYSMEMADVLQKLDELSKRCPPAPFQRPTPKGMVFSLTPCPNPDPEGYRKDRKCKRL